jgi:hypothetical protein
MRRSFQRAWSTLLLLALLISAGRLDALQAAAPVAEASGPISPAAIPAADWPQLGRDPQRTNYSPQQIDPPYCYAWKWYGVPFASRAQPVVVSARLFIGGMDGKLYARNATTGAALWAYQTGGPIRHSPGVLGNTVVTGSHDGYTYALDATTGALLWRTFTGASATAPLLDEARNRVYVASTDGYLRAMSLTDGVQQWAFNAGAPILTSPSLSADGNIVFLGNQAIQALAVNAATGAEVWRRGLQGQSLGDRYPVVAGNAVVYRSQPLYHFHLLLREGDQTLNLAGPRGGNTFDPTVWAADWSAVRPHILDYLNSQPSKQTLFVLNAADGASRGTAPVLYTYGNNDSSTPPVIGPAGAYLMYRPRHGIQTDSNTVHVTTQYDAELGQMNLASLDVTGLRSNAPLSGSPEFRLTSDEPAMLTMGGNILWVDNWERLGGLNVSTGQLLHVGTVSTEWPECYGGTGCGPAGPRPFFPLSAGQPAYPFPWPRVTDGAARDGVVVANNMLYWRVIEGGLAGVKSGSCSTQVWTASPEVRLARIETRMTAAPLAPVAGSNTVYLPLITRSYSTLSAYILNDLTTPVANPPAVLVNRLRSEVQAMLQLANGQHLLPFYFERGFSRAEVWPYNSDSCGGSSCIASIHYPSGGIFGSTVWHDPGELLYTLAAAYPYLDSGLQAQARTYLAAEMNRYPPLQNLPYGDSNRDWLRQGVARERYAVPFRGQLNNWPPVAANVSAIYALWLWSKNTNDWTYACNNWNAARSLFNARRNSVRYYADIAGLIGYARLAQGLQARSCAGVTSADYDAGYQTALAALQAGAGAANFNAYRTRADNDYLDPRDIASGWSAPVFFGLTPEVGRYLREQTGGAAANYLVTLQSGNGVQWWYLTQVGVHAEEGETSYLSPFTGWSHFLGRAYVVGDTQATLTRWLDRPWTTGDFYSLQKIVMTIHAP